MTEYYETRGQVEEALLNLDTSIVAMVADQAADGNTMEQLSCWVTLVTKPTYLPGAIVLAHSLNKHKSSYPLLVQYTSSLGDEAAEALKVESQRTGNILTQAVKLLLPRKDQENEGSVAERFKDTFTKLRAFEVYKLGYTKCCFLDADMAVFQNPDSVFDTKLAGKDWLGANHACVCNLDQDSWAPEDWQKGNCAYTPITNPNGIAAEITEKSRPTYHLLNSGMFLYHPSEELWMRMLDFFNTTDKLKGYQFPDQDFLADFFYNKWKPISWKYNALKTMRYWHPRMWSDDVVAVLHYIVDKPWERKVCSEGIAGHLGRDGDTHQWWWNLYKEWRKTAGCSRQGDEVVAVMEKLVDTEKPFAERTPSRQEPGRPEDVRPWP